MFWPVYGPLRRILNRRRTRMIGTFDDEEFYIDEYAWPLDPEEREKSEAGIEFSRMKSRLTKWKKDKINEAYCDMGVNDLFDLVDDLNNTLVYESYDIPVIVRNHFEEQAVDFYIKTIKEVRDFALKLIDRIEEGELK